MKTIRTLTNTRSSRIKDKGGENVWELPKRKKVLKLSRVKQEPDCHQTYQQHCTEDNSIITWQKQKLENKHIFKSHTQNSIPRQFLSNQVWKAIKQTNKQKKKNKKKHKKPWNHKNHRPGFPGGLDGKESACNAGDAESVPGSGRSPEEGNGYLLWYPFLENPMDRRA